ncbi:hypothetical protein BRO54_2226 [Geobacillus proteiniphilus]|uniref:Uncharacterized protein n=1 Tax=Geobacillus proteiniphilus TaxID=860353 RepID=A0A1Q5SY67_9BACL|nr:hypothetical protein BRO54_2226 [Geobacillus proteiniphilus]
MLSGEACGFLFFHPTANPPEGPPKKEMAEEITNEKGEENKCRHF